MAEGVRAFLSILLETKQGIFHDSRPTLKYINCGTGHGKAFPMHQTDLFPPPAGGGADCSLAAGQPSEDQPTLKASAPEARKVAPEGALNFPLEFQD